MKDPRRPKQDLHSSPDECHVQEHDDQTAGHSQFLADDGEQEIGGVFGQISEFLNTIPKSMAGESTPRDGRHRLQHVVADATWIRIWIHERPQSIQAIGISEECRDDGGTRKRQWKDRVLDPAATGDQHDHPHKYDDQSCPQILNADQAADQEHDDGAREQAGSKPFQIPSPERTLPGEKENQAPLGYFTWLKADWTDVDPSLRPMNFPSDARDLHGYQQEDRNTQQSHWQPATGWGFKSIQGHQHAGDEGQQGEQGQNGRPAHQHA